MRALANKYKSASVESMSPGRIILLLFDTSLDCINKAEKAINEPFSVKTSEVLHNNLNKAGAIFSELQACLNFEAAESFAKTMYGLYDYMNSEISKCRTKRTPDSIQNIKNVLLPIRNAWADMLAKMPEKENVSLASISCNV